jgi:UDP-2-acetamido-3-amino-2,3-dideoxy-glucuronate N-acetyltransferase
MTEQYFRHPHAIVETASVGERTRIWAFAHVLPGARIGVDCNICDHVFIEADVVVGDRVTVKSGVQLWDGVTLEDDVFVGPNATFTNDPFPRSRRRPAEYTRTVVHAGASIGANATILPGTHIGPNAMVGAGAVVMHDVPANAIVIGNPAFIKGYVDAAPSAAAQRTAVADENRTVESRVRGVTLHQRMQISDLRGSLAFSQIGDGLPFQPRRYFFVFDVPSRQIRGAHAHRTLEQFLVAVKGDCSVLVDDGINREEFALNTPTMGLHIRPMVWATQFKFSSDAILLVLASAEYDAADYIRVYEEFLKLAVQPAGA